jgi:hypothetical protein
MVVPKRPFEALHDSVSHALQPPKPTITACDTDNTATSVEKNEYSDFGGGKKNNLIQRFCHIT